jgi:hypothetical protein
MSAVVVTELGCPGHLIVSRWCQWRRHTQIGWRYRVSSIGNYFPRGDDKRSTVGSGPKDFFETMVFETSDNPADGAASEGCGCKAVKGWGEIDGTRYATAGDAQKGHERFVAKYRRKAEKARKA